MEYELLVRKLIDLECLPLNIITSGLVNDHIFNKKLYDGTCIWKQLEVINKNLGIPTNTTLISKLEFHVLENSSERFNLSEEVLKELDIKFDYNQKEQVEFEQFEGSLLQEKLFLALIELEDKYINKFVDEKSNKVTNEKNIGKNKRLSAEDVSANNTTTTYVKISKYLESLFDPTYKPDQIEKQASCTSFTYKTNSEEIKRWFVKALSNSQGIDSQESHVFIIKDCEYLAKLLMRGYKVNHKKSDLLVEEEGNNTFQAKYVDEQEEMIGFLESTKKKFSDMFDAAVEIESEKEFLIYIQPKLAYGFVSKHQGISQKTVYLFIEVFKKFGIHYNRHLDYDSVNSNTGNTSDNVFKNVNPLYTAQIALKPLKNIETKQIKTKDVFLTANVDKKLITLENWFMQEYFIKLLFHGIEKNGNLDQEFINIILLTGKENAVKILNAFLKDSSYSSKNHLVLIERVTMVLFDTGPNIFEIILPIFDTIIDILLKNIFTNKDQNISMKMLFSLLTNTYVRLDMVKINKDEIHKIIKSLHRLFKGKFDLSLISIILHCLRFLSQSFIAQDKLLTISPKSLQNLNCPVIEEFLQNADEIVHSLVCSITLMSNNIYKDMLLNNCMPGICHKKVGELVISSYKRLLKFHKTNFIHFVNLSDMDFFLKWAINVEILDNNAYTSQFEILNELNECKYWRQTTKATQLTMIRVRQIDGNVTIFDFLLKRLRSYINEIGVYEEDKLKKNACLKDVPASKMNKKKYLRINYLSSIINGILGKIHDYESLHNFLTFLAKLLDMEIKNTMINKNFIEKILLKLDENYNLGIFKNKAKNRRILNKTQLSATIESDNNSELIRSDFVEKEMVNLLGKQQPDISELYGKSESNSQKSFYSNSQLNYNSPLNSSTEKYGNAKKNNYRPILKRNALDWLIKRMKYGYFNTNLMTMISETPTDMSMIRKSAKEFDYKRFFDCPFKKKPYNELCAANDNTANRFAKVKALKMSGSYKNVFKFDKLKQQLYQKNLIELKYKNSMKSTVFSLEQKSVKWFFFKYNKLLVELFRVYSGSLRSKDLSLGGKPLATKGLQHYSEFWSILKDLEYSKRNKIPQVVQIIKEVKIEKSKSAIKSELYIDFEEFIKVQINFLILDSQTNLNEDTPVTHLLNKFVCDLKESPNTSKNLNKCLFDNPFVMTFPADISVIKHLENEVKDLFEDKYENFYKIQEYKLPLMYEFYEEKNVAFKNKFRLDQFKRRVDNKWLVCYEILTDIIDDVQEINCFDKQPEVETNIKIRLNKEWHDPLIKFKESHGKVPVQNNTDIQNEEKVKAHTNNEKYKTSRILEDFISKEQASMIIDNQEKEEQKVEKDKIGDSNEEFSQRDIQKNYNNDFANNISDLGTEFEYEEEKDVEKNNIFLSKIIVEDKTSNGKLTQKESEKNQEESQYSEKDSKNSQSNNSKSQEDQENENDRKDVQLKTNRTESKVDPETKETSKKYISNKHISNRIIKKINEPNSKGESKKSSLKDDENKSTESLKKVSDKNSKSEYEEHENDAESKQTGVKNTISKNNSSLMKKDKDLNDGNQNLEKQDEQDTNISEKDINKDKPKKKNLQLKRLDTKLSESEYNEEESNYNQSKKKVTLKKIETKFEESEDNEEESDHNKTMRSDRSPIKTNDQKKKKKLKKQENEAKKQENEAKIQENEAKKQESDSSIDKLKQSVHQKSERIRKEKKKAKKDIQEVEPDSAEADGK